MLEYFKYLCEMKYDSCNETILTYFFKYIFVQRKCHMHLLLKLQYNISGKCFTLYLDVCLFSIIYLYFKLYLDNFVYMLVRGATNSFNGGSWERNLDFGTFHSGSSASKTLPTGHSHILVPINRGVLTISPFCGMNPIFYVLNPDVSKLLKKPGTAKIAINYFNTVFKGYSLKTFSCLMVQRILIFCFAGYISFRYK